jgi:hypothetical protein
MSTLSHLRRILPLGLPPVLWIAALAAACASPPEPDEGELEWIALFNGEDLTGWTVKITGQDLGADPWGTFRVEDGLLTVGYESYEGFEGRFGHIFYEEPFSHYHLRVEYRFVGDQIPDAPGWAFKNSGVMFHSQSPESMLTDQAFPLSIEAQFLGGDGTEERPTGNVCTPGTHIEIDGVLVEDHCITADAPTIHGEEWVTVDLLVLGDSLVAHVMGEDTVLTYSRPIVGGATVEEFGEPAREDGRVLSGGYIALQSESHPIQFRQVLLRPLPSGGL